MRRCSTQVGTDTATIYAISPEGLRRAVQDWLPLADCVWGEKQWVKCAPMPAIFSDMETIIQQHGGAVFHTGGDGVTQVDVEGAVDAAGFMPPYGTPDYGKTASRRVRASVSRVATLHQAKVVVARVLRAGWWAIFPGKSGVNPPPVDKGGLMNAVPGIDPAQAARYNGDGPADLMDDTFNRIDLEYLRAWGRHAYPDEIAAVFDFCFGPMRKGMKGSRPLNRWIDNAAAVSGVDIETIGSLDEDSLKTIERNWRETVGRIGPKGPAVVPGGATLANPDVIGTEDAWDSFKGVVDTELWDARNRANRWTEKIPACKASPGSIFGGDCQ